MKKVLIFFSILLIANNNLAEENLVTENITENIQQPVKQKLQKIIIDVKSVYDSLDIKDKIDYSIFQKAYLGYVQILNKNPGVLIIIDYSKPSNEERFYVLDLNKKQLVYSTRVAHSKNSGLEIPLEFSDDPNSYQSSLGFFLTLGEYNGAYGYSLRLKGLEENINANAESRAIVIHGGDIVNDEYIKKFGFAGRSLGCPVLPTALTKEIVNYIKQGRVLFINGNDEEYIEESVYLSKLAPIFEGKPQDIVELEKPRETLKVVATTSTASTTSLASTSPVITNTTAVQNPNQKNISIMLDVIKQEAEYKQYSSLRKKENYIDYLAIIKSIIVDKSNLTTTKHNGETSIVSNLDSAKENKEEKTLEKIETTSENKNQNIEEIKKDVTKQEEVKKEESKKAEVKKTNRNYSEEVVRKSLGLGVKLK